jgi:hypothetical protein
MLNMIMNDDDSCMLAVHLMFAIFRFTLDIHVALLILYIFIPMFVYPAAFTHEPAAFSSSFFDTSFTITNCINITVRKKRSFMNHDICIRLF